MRRYFSWLRGSPARCLVMAVLLAGGCSVAPPRAPPGVDAADLWQQRTQRLEALGDWSFSGRAALSGTDVQARTVRIRWEQGQGGFNIAFQSLIGQRVAELSGDLSGVVLRLPDEAPVTATNSADLLKAAIGWSAPVESLRYWVLGLPDPLAQDEHVLDVLGRLSSLQQDGWRIEYSQYVAVDGVDLPRRVTATHPDLRIRLVIDRWELERGNGRG